MSNGVRDNFGKQLKFLRVEHKCTQREIAEYLNITTRAYQHYEESKRFPSVETVIALSKKYNVSFLEVLFGSLTLKKRPITFSTDEECELLEDITNKANALGISANDFMSYAMLSIAFSD